jgi:hypothetical protein
VKASFARGLVLVAILVFLTYLVWGLFAFRRGMFQDEVYILAEVNSFGRGLGRFFMPMTSPTRILAGTPFALALLTPSPVATLQLFYGLAWLGSGIASALVLLRIFPDRRGLAFAGGCLTICSTGDYLADSLVALHYDLSALFYVLSLAAFLAWLRGGKAGSLVAGGVLLSASVWTVDVAFAAILLAPAFLWMVDGFSRRWKVAVLVIALAFAPYACVFGRALLAPGSYTGDVAHAIELRKGLFGVAAAFAHNFVPWSWGRARQNWFPAPAPVIPSWIRLAGPLAAVAAFLIGGAASSAGLRPPGEADARVIRHDLVFVVVFLVMALASNAQQGVLTFAEFFYRTQILSRYFASMALALAADMLIRCGGAPRAIATVLVTGFVGLGVDGGLDRQDYFLGYWSRHRVELQSILDAAPRVAPEATLILDVPKPPPYFVATQVDYLAQSWASLLYDDSSMWKRTVLLSPFGGDRCRADSGALSCRDSGGREVVSEPLARCVILSYDWTRNRYARAEEVPLDLASGAPGAPRAYQPDRWVISATPSRVARRLLDAPAPE